MKTSIFLFFCFLGFAHVFASEYHVGPGQAMTTIAEVPWDSLQAGDKVYIHWQNNTYKEKWVINCQGTEAERIEVIGVSGPDGEQPVIDGDGALTPVGLDYWNEDRGVIKIGGSNIPTDGLPNYITIENLEIRSGHQDYQFTNSRGLTETYSDNAAAIYVEKAANLIIRNCTLHDSGNGLSIGPFGGLTKNILIENNHFYNNGIIGSAYEHNSYTTAIDITYQFNHYGPLKAGADGNNLKDRSAGLVVSYNWIEGGNRQLDLVDAHNKPELLNHPRYHTTHVYGNILIEPAAGGNSQIVHYGGDSGTESDYRKGDLYFYNNTIISTRTDFTTLMKLSSNDEAAHVFNNVVYTTAPGVYFAMIAGKGIFNMHHNWLKTGWKACHCSPTGVINDLGNNLTGFDPLFEDFTAQEFKPQGSSPLVNQGDVIPSDLLPDHNVIFEYYKHQDFGNRTISGNLDMGAFEFDGVLSIDLEEAIKPEVYPNPVNEILTIKYLEYISQSYEIYNISGRLIQSGFLMYENQVNVSDLLHGIYFVRLINQQQSVLMKFVK